MESGVAEASRRELLERARRMSPTERLRAFEALCRQAADLAASRRRRRPSRRS